MRKAGLRILILSCGLAIFLALPGAVRADLTVVTDDRAIETNALVETAGGVSDEIEIRVSTGVVFDVSVLADSEEGAVMATGEAAQNSTVASTSFFSGSGSSGATSTMGMPGDISEGSGLSVFDVIFTVTEAALFDLSVDLMTGLTGSGASSASVLFQIVGGATLASTSVFDGDAGMFMFPNMMLLPDTMYRLIVDGSSAASDGGTASADWTFELGASAPEPAAFALLTLGLVGLALSRRTLH